MVGGLRLQPRERGGEIGNGLLEGGIGNAAFADTGFGARDRSFA